MGLERLVTKAVLKGISKDAEKEVEADEEGAITLRIHGAYPIIGYISIFIGLGLTFLSWGEGLGISMTFLGLFGGLGFLCVLLGRMEAVMNKQGIDYSGVFGSMKSIDWEEIQSAVYNPNSMELVIKSDYEKIKIHRHMVGFGQLAEKVNKHVHIQGI